MAQSRNMKDAQYVKTFTLPAAASTSTTSTVLDLGADPFKPEDIEVELAVPALSTTIAPDTRTATYIIETSTTSNFSAVDQTLYSEVFTGASSAGIGAKTKLVRLPSNSARYIRGKVTFGASTTDGSAVSATFSLKF